MKIAGMGRGERGGGRGEGVGGSDKQIVVGLELAVA